MRIVALDGYTLNPGDNPWDAVASQGKFEVHDRTPAEQIVERSTGADIVVTNKVPYSSDTLAALPDLKFIAVTATGYNIVDVAAARERNIPVSNVPVYGTDTVAQHVLAVLLTQCHHPAAHDQAIREGQWQAKGDFCFWNTPLIELAGKTIGIVGLGRIGRRVAELANAFGMRVIAHSRSERDPLPYGGFAWRSIDDLFAEADVVSLHCPQTDENVGMVNAALLSRMKREAIFINTARGALVNEADLAAALNSGTIAGACLDVLSKEPPSPDNPLLAAKNCLITPHIAWATLAARQRVMATTAENIAGFIAGKPVHVVN